MAGKNKEITLIISTPVNESRQLKIGDFFPDPRQGEILDKELLPTELHLERVPSGSVVGILHTSLNVIISGHSLNSHGSPITVTINCGNEVAVHSPSGELVFRIRALA